MFCYPSSTVACIPSFHSLGLVINRLVISVLWISLFISRLGFLSIVLDLNYSLLSCACVFKQAPYVFCLLVKNDLSESSSYFKKSNMFNLEGKGRTTKGGPTSKGKTTPKSARAQIPSLGLKPFPVM
jgi:hypothetical protein